tara:strand:+ start:5662 stop:6345 length:684 start_codon:yes stop_codon:yes gene_type:complete
MKKSYRIIFLITIFIILSTYIPINLKSNIEKKNNFFKIKNIIVTNNFLVEKEEVNRKLEKIHKKNIFLIKRQDVEKPLKGIDFLKRIEVKKKYPDTIIVKIFETTPIAVLFKKKDKFLLDNSSNLISLNKKIDDNQLPKIFGDKAENNFISFYNKLKSNKFPTDKIKNYYFFQIERWDLELLNNKVIKYPHNNTEDAIKKSIELLNRKDFEKYNIIDLRVDGKIIVE